MHFIIIINIISHLAATKESDSNENIYKVNFRPNQLSLKVNSAKRIYIGLRCTRNPPNSFESALVLKDGNNLKHVKLFNFTNDTETAVDLHFSSVGRFTYYVEFVKMPDIKVRGSLVVHVYKKKWAEILCYILGWTYFLLWSISFYPQIILNHRRKSVIGLSFDFATINFVGFLPFLIFNVLIYFPCAIQNGYFEVNPHSPLPVELNDVVFSIHATLLCAITLIQCCIFERGDQGLTVVGNGFVIISIMFVLLCGILVITSKITLLYYIVTFSYIKLASTLVKSIPQIYFNYKRKSTVGWSITAVILDIAGGLCSFFQQFIIAVNYAKWSVIYGNIVKLLLGIGSILFDVIFILQHYVLYRSMESM